MNSDFLLSKYSLGVGDRFSHQAEAQLSAIIKAGQSGVPITPVWNKSYREHTIISSKPAQTRIAADEAVINLNWNNPYFVDADHINIDTVDLFAEYCDFFTIDVAKCINKEAQPDQITRFLKDTKPLIGEHVVPGLDQKVVINDHLIRKTANTYAAAINEAAHIYDRIAEKKQKNQFIIEVSMDETDLSQTPVEIVLISIALARRKIPLHTIAPKFSGRFNKGVDYRGDINQFSREFSEIVALLQWVKSDYNLLSSLKISVHSGSDKFSLYPVMNRIMRTFDVGIHLKTAGTTWLEELIGLAEAGDTAFELAKDVYELAFQRYDELVKPYAEVIDINRKNLPDPDEVQKWDGDTYARTLRHIPSESLYNRDFRQLLHIGYKVAAEMGDSFTQLLMHNKKIIAKNVSENIYTRHIKPLFIDQ
jgi:hypothetical protein